LRGKGLREAHGYSAYFQKLFWAAVTVGGREVGGGGSVDVYVFFNAEFAVRCPETLAVIGTPLLGTSIVFINKAITTTTLPGYFAGGTWVAL
jgi:hypothetical protein